MVTAVIVAGGKGTRMGPGIDKLFLEVAGRPVVAHTWAAFDACPHIDSIALVVRKGLEATYRELANLIGARKPWLLVEGGAERQDSVWNGIQAAPRETTIVAIQDAARPCASNELIAATIQAARANGAAVAAQPVVDTIKESEDNRTVLRTLDRKRLWAVQTPQTFQIEVLRRAISEVRNKGLQLTDDTAACEYVGQRVVLVPSIAPNPKVTTREDLPYVEFLLRQRDIMSSAAARG